MAAAKIGMKTWRVALIAGAAFALTIPGISSEALAEKKVRILQTASILGNCYIELSPTSVAAKNGQLSLEVYGKAPAWQIQFFNKRNHRKLTMAADKFVGSFTARAALTDVNFNALNWKRQSEEKRAGIDTEHWFATGLIKNPTAPIILNTFKIRRIDYWLAKKGFAAPPVGRFMRRLYCTPDLDGYPIAFELTDLDLKKQTILETRPLNISNITFVPPDGKDFETVHSEREVFFINIDGLLKDGMLKDDFSKLRW